jgi:hypothetical protein
MTMRSRPLSRSHLILSLAPSLPSPLSYSQFQVADIVSSASRLEVNPLVEKFIKSDSLSFQCALSTAIQGSVLSSSLCLCLLPHTAQVL